MTVEKMILYSTTPEKQDKTSELSKHWSPDSTCARNEVIMKTTYPVNQKSATKTVVIFNKCMLLCMK